MTRYRRMFRAVCSSIFFLNAISSAAFAQQNGVIVLGPGKAVTGWRVETVPPPKPSCERGAPPASEGETVGLPDLEFLREGLTCIRHEGGRTEELRGRPAGSSSSAGTHIAYWSAEKQEVRVFSVADGSDTVVETLAGAKVHDLSWSSRGLTLAYVVTKAGGREIHAIDLESGKRNTFSERFGRPMTAPDPGHVVAVGPDGIERLRIADGQRDLLIPAHYVEEALFSAGGAFLGMVSITTSESLTLPPEKAFAKPSSDTEDDGPDCSGGSRYLVLWKKAAKALLDVPFPEGFDSVLDFEFSPDERSLAVTYGSGQSCDYPGDLARVFVVSLTDFSLRAISPADRLSVRAHWSPDGRTIVYTDFSGYGAQSTPGLVAADVSSGKLSRITNPGTNGPDEWVGWR